jgi:hypothetical protein
MKPATSTYLACCGPVMEHMNITKAADEEKYL